MFVLGFFRQKDGRFLLKVSGGEGAGTAATRGQRLLDFGLHGEVAVGGVAQEDEAQNGQAVFGGGEFGVGAKLIGRFPQVVFEFGDVLQGCGSSVVDLWLGPGVERP